MSCPVCNDDGPGRSAAYFNWINVASARAWHMMHNLSAVYPTANYLYVSGNRGTSVGLFQNAYHQRALRAMGLRASTAFGCAVNYLLFPRPETLEVIKEEMDQVLAAPMVFGVQIRTDDKHMAGQDLAESYAAQYRYMFECAESMERAIGILPGGPIAPKWFLVSDSVVVRQQAQIWYPNKTIVYMRSKPRHVSDSATGDMHGSRLAAAEHWVFGMTDYQVIHWWSGYGRTAAMRAMREMGVHALEAKKDDCSIENSQDVWQLGDGYSGVRRQGR
ncbi:hypothetical protein HXX76_000176 [Chlamydomonas incerta]|uniref:Uncharacterized protein n=1 Tax=Chlamydomonas incerta TaxID=51695 RepID=A0A835WDW0_CHLIN|nr:hypothetical protein HXX76_000176 [Chlamydomonas incerta]|eukprot:KAG2445563.1 hypothetical protein HXX76_000176 [Chlamydomonas incerta]